MPPDADTLFGPHVYAVLREALRVGFTPQSAVSGMGTILARLWVAADGPARMAADPRCFPRDRIVLRAVGRTDVSVVALDPMTLYEAIVGRWSAGGGPGDD